MDFREWDTRTLRRGCFLAACLGEGLYNPNAVNDSAITIQSK